MSIDQATRLCEIFMALSFIQQSVEHFWSYKDEQILFLPRVALAILLILGIQTAWVLLALLLLGVLILHKFQGPYNGGSDRMSLLVLSSLCLVNFAPNQYWQEIFFGYLGLQLVLSYFISGWVKIVNPEWRNGLALQDVFRFSAYPVSKSLREWANWPRVLFTMSWGVMVFELVFPLTMLWQPALITALLVAAAFHLSNACFFGLNRFFWIWLSAYPSILWLQHRIFAI